MVKFHAGTLETTILNMRNIALSEQKAARAATTAAGEQLFKHVQQNISLRDHSLQDMRGLDHPYARRHGSIRIHQSGSKSLLHPSYRVHAQSESMLRSLRKAMLKSGNDLRYRVWLDTATAPHAKYVVGQQPSAIMLPRDVLWDTAQAPFVRAKMMRKITDKLGRSLRAQGTLRFTKGV